MWYGFDPGGTFGLAMLDNDGNYTCAIAKSFDDALDYVSADCDGIGIDSVLWWSHRQGGGRRADDVVRQACISGGGKGGTVSPINSLQGAMFIPAYLLIRAIRIKLGPVNVTEAHPKLFFTLCSCLSGVPTEVMGTYSSRGMIFVRDGN